MFKCQQLLIVGIITFMNRKKFELSMKKVLKPRAQFAIKVYKDIQEAYVDFAHTSIILIKRK